MRKKRIIWLAALPLLLIISPAFGLRCNHGLVNNGDTTGTVRKKCGPPDFVYIDTGKYRRGRFAPVDQRWYYNYGPRLLLQELRFHNGVLEGVDTSSYGFRVAVERCTPQDMRIGMSAYELISRCGTPKSKRERYTRIGGKGSGGKVVLHREEWTYDFGAQYLLHKAVIAGGHVQYLETIGRKK
jgi:Protein of unknown function (DUF2845)